MAKRLKDANAINIWTSEGKLMSLAAIHIEKCLDSAHFSLGISGATFYTHGYPQILWITGKSIFPTEYLTGLYGQEVMK
ncbi:hypothetical protein [Legionella sp. 16cNR16C]|uniref:hypothetical protein n=1 Tax=Legionella sp. 16cNR16C TaxID=2905656 RepID=UPI001E2E1A69|nr:hypothetical protein [Legionella sp. 16cNR16C]MCE3045613.1 hypothetical protein [Legionella sp. 16cNR16C]